MKDLQIIQHDNQLVADSRQVAEMIEKEHKHLMRDIQGYMDILGKSKIGLSEFFIESTYVSSQNKELPCYLLTRKGCDMVANKMTGEKGILFTANYIEKFYEMEQQLHKPMTQLEVIAANAAALVEQERKIKALAARQEAQNQELYRQTKEIKILDAKIQTYPTDFFSIAGYASLRGINVDISKARILGCAASKMSKENGYDTGSVSDPRFGRVNTYHIDILKEIFKSV